MIILPLFLWCNPPDPHATSRLFLSSVQLKSGNKSSDGADEDVSTFVIIRGESCGNLVASTILRRRAHGLSAARPKEFIASKAQTPE